jgi:hypothetical protein
LLNEGAKRKGKKKKKSLENNPNKMDQMEQEVNNNFQD